MPSTRQRTLRKLNPPNIPSTAQPVAAKPTKSSSASPGPPNTRPNQPPPFPTPSHPLHQQWEFAAVWQFLFQFHQGLKSHHYDDIEEFARDICSPTGTPLLHNVQIGLLKNVSSQRGLTIEMFDDYTRRQYINRRAPYNPFGTGLLPVSFYSLNPEERVRVLHQLSMWIIGNTDIFRTKIDPHKMADQTDWRVDPIGWDSKGNAYYQFDNGYLYCRTEPPLPAYQKWKSRKPAGNRSTKRRKITQEEEEEEEVGGSVPLANDNDTFVSQIVWKCLCSTIGEYRALVLRFEKSKNADEKELRKVILEDILPVFEKEEQKRKRKLLEEEKEIARLELLSGRKRSARVDERMARRREAEEREQALQLEREEKERQEKEEVRRQKEEEARVARLEERERRLQERELRAKQREEERTRLLDPDATESEDNKTVKGRKSSRQREKRKAELEMEDKEWLFDCTCGTFGKNFDDGSYSIACDRCGVWQHTKCAKLPQSAAEEDDFICDRCRDKETAALSPPIKIKLRLTARPASSEVEERDPKIPPISARSGVFHHSEARSSKPGGKTPEYTTVPSPTSTTLTTDLANTLINKNHSPSPSQSNGHIVLQNGLSDPPASIPTP